MFLKRTGTETYHFTLPLLVFTSLIHDLILFFFPFSPQKSVASLVSEKKRDHKIMKEGVKRDFNRSGIT